MTRRKKKSRDYRFLFLQTIRRKYQYLLIGLTLVVISITLINNFFVKNNQTDKNSSEIKASQNNKTATAKLPNYIVKAEDNLWNIAENTYGSGYNAYDIATANKITDPNMIFVNQSLILPSITPKQPTKGEVLLASTTAKVTITGSSYTVRSGDCLWNIAAGAYGDGFAWVRIAKANNLAEPNIIHIGNILSLPR